MKTSNLLITLVLLALASCVDKSFETEEISVIESSEMRYTQGVFPNSPAFLGKMSHGSRSGDITFETDWEQYEKVTLNSGESVETPWSKDGFAGDIIPLLAQDVKKERGWVFVYHTLMGHNIVDKGVNYMIFYNHCTGCLKVFYYCEENLGVNNGGIWKLSFEKPQKWLNAVMPVSIPYNYGGYNNWICINMSSNDDDNNNGFVKGWNAVTLPLAYSVDSPDNTMISIRMENNLTSDVKLSYNGEAVTKGTLISSTSKNSDDFITGSMARQIGSAAEDKAIDILGKSLTGIIGPVTIGKLVEKGITKLLSSFTGQHNKDIRDTTYVDLTTTFSGVISGNIVFSGVNSMSPIVIPVNKELWGTEMGSWNLSCSPTVYIHPLGVIKSQRGSDSAEYTFERSGKYKVDIVFNPELRKHLVNYWVDVYPVRFYSMLDELPYAITGRHDYGSLGAPKGQGSSEMGNLVLQSDFLLNEDNGNRSLNDDYYRSCVTFEGIKEKYNLAGNKMPKYISVPKMKDLARSFDLRYKSENRMARVVVHMVTNFENKIDTTVVSRTYVPQIEWDPELLSKFNFTDFNMLEEYVESLKDPIIMQQVERNGVTNY